MVREKAALASVPYDDPKVWGREARLALYEVCVTRDFFTVNDVWERLTRWGVPEPEYRECMGRVLSQGRFWKWCIKTKNTLHSDRPFAHRRAISVWRSAGPNLPEWSEEAPRAKRRGHLRSG
jgi:hypothetical protein